MMMKDTSVRAYLYSYIEVYKTYSYNDSLNSIKAIISLSVQKLPEHINSMNVIHT